MSAEVEVIIARYSDVLTIPVAAVAGTAEAQYCWVKTSDGPQRRSLELGDTNDVYTVVKGGVNEGDEVFLNPVAFEQTGTEVLKPLDKAETGKPMSAGSGIDIDVLTNYTKKMELETLNGNLNAAKAKLAAEEERAKMDAIRRDLAIEELQYCTVKAEKSGLVIYPSAAQWKNTPEIEEGATVHMDQVLLLMPDLSKMQVKVGIHESVIERIKPGLEAKVTLPDRTLDGKVASVSSVTRPAGWWTGNVVKYDTIIELPSVGGLKPGMSAEVKVLIKRHEDVLTIPVTAVVETAKGDFCWVQTTQGSNGVYCNWATPMTRLWSSREVCRKGMKSSSILWPILRKRNPRC